ncbi:MAG: porin family protein [Bacteroidales bacterium]|nr:porin family protein [Bacteroidales bacterium]
MSGKNTIEENMKKITILLALSLMFAFSASAQNYEEGDMNLNLNIGLGSGQLPENIKLPPTSIQFEYGIAENFGLGLMVGYANTDYEIRLSNGDVGNFKTGHFLLGGISQYHFYSSERSTVFAKAMLGYDITSVTFNSDDGMQADDFDNKNPALIYGIHIGGNYYFSDNAGIFAEIGYGLSILNIGLTLKL